MTEQAKHGLTLRGWRDDGDFAIIADLCNRATFGDGDTFMVTPDSVRAQYLNLNNTDLARDVQIAEMNGEPVGYGRVEFWDEENGARIYMIFGRIAPEWRRHGIGTAMLARNEQRVAELAQLYPTEREQFLQSSAGSDHVGNIALLDHAGYQAVRYGFDMVRDLSQPIGSTDLPAGIEVRTPTPDQYRQVWDADVEAFRDHWGYRVPTEDDYKGWLEWSYLAPHLWQVAWQGDEIVGMVQNFINANENAKTGIQRGYTEGISVRRPWRKRGIATALINRSLLMFRDMGMTEAALGVDAENTSGALRVYKGCGFVVTKQATTYRKALENIEQHPEGTRIEHRGIRD